jgi:hypothetical protein
VSAALRRETIHRASHPASTRVRRPLRDAHLSAAGRVLDPPVSRRAQQRLRGRRALGMDRLQPDGICPEATPANARPRPAHHGGGRPDRRCSVGRGRRLGSARLDVAGYRCAPGRGTGAAVGEPRPRGRCRDDPAQCQRRTCHGSGQRHYDDQGHQDPPEPPHLLDATTVALLIDHRQQVITRCAEIGAEFDERQFLFSYQPDHSRPCSPSGVTHRYARMVGSLGIRTRLHAIRHYSATELLASGVDLRTVAGRLGHGSGGATTLKVYAAWMARADQRCGGGRQRVRPAASATAGSRPPAAWWACRRCTPAAWPTRATNAVIEGQRAGSVEVRRC